MVCATPGAMLAALNTVWLMVQVSEVPSLVIVNGVMAFYEHDCSGGLDPLFLPDQISPLFMSLTDVHTRLTAAVSALCEKAAVVMFTVDAVVQMDDAAGITSRDPLPPAWKVCAAFSLRLHGSCLVGRSRSRTPCTGTTEFHGVAGCGHKVLGYL